MLSALQQPFWSGLNEFDTNPPYPSFQLVDDFFCLFLLLSDSFLSDLLHPLRGMMQALLWKTWNLYLTSYNTDLKFIVLHFFIWNTSLIQNIHVDEYPQIGISTCDLDFGSRSQMSTI